MCYTYVRTYIFTCMYVRTYVYCSCSFQFESRVVLPDMVVLPDCMEMLDNGNYSGKTYCILCIVHFVCICTYVIVVLDVHMCVHTVCSQYRRVHQICTSYQYLLSDLVEVAYMS